MMKKVAIAVLLMTGLTAMAQRESREGGRAMNDMTAEQMADLQTKKMTLALDLTPEQQEKIGALNLENAKMRKSKMDERKNMAAEGERSKRTSDQRHAMQSERLDHMIAQKSELKNILSNEQYAKWESQQKRSGKRRAGQHQKGKDREKQGTKTN